MGTSEPRFPKQHERAAGFCLDQGFSDLFDFVEMNVPRPVEDLDVSTLEALSADLATRLNEKRRWAQSQQSNPKFATLARQYIAAYNDILAAAKEPATHIRCLQQRRDAVEREKFESLIADHLGTDGKVDPAATPILRSVGKSFGMSDEAIERLLAPYLRAQARPEPVTGSSFHNIDRDAPTSPRRPVIPTQPLIKTPPEPREAPERVSEAARPDFSLRRDGSSPAGRGLHSAPTAPPVRREFGPSSTPAPADPSAVKRATPTPAPSARAVSGALRSVGQRNFSSLVFGVPTVVAEPSVEFLGTLPPTATIETRAEWLIPDRDTLDPLGPPIERIQSFKVFVDPKRMPSNKESSQILVRSRAGDTVVFSFEVERRFNWAALLRGMGLSIGVAAMALLIVFLVRLLLAPTHGPMLVVRVDPSADAIVVDGQNVGAGPEIQVEHPRLGTRSIIVVKEHFATVERTVEISPTEPTVLDVVLTLESALDFTPAPSDRAGRAPADGAQRVIEAARPCLDEAGTAGLRGSADATVILRPDGLVTGIQLRGALPSPVPTCVRRRIAALRYPPLESGDYAEIRARLSIP